MTTYSVLHDGVTESQMDATYKVLFHLGEMKFMYDKILNMSPFELHEYLCNLEEEYINCFQSAQVFEKFKDLYGQPSINYCHVVHKLSPKIYDLDIADFFNSNGYYFSLKSLLHCCKCNKQLTSEQSYNLHIFGKSTKCSDCDHKITSESLLVMSTIKKYNNSKKFLLKNENFLSNVKELPEKLDEKIDTWKEFCTKIKEHMGKKFNDNVRNALHFVVNYFKPDNFLCTRRDLIKAMYSQLSFVTKICDKYEYWTNKQVIKESINRYFKFMKLIAQNKSRIFVPTMDIDLVWHTHLTNPRKYKDYCIKIAGQIINHDDTISSTDLKSGYAKTYIEWRKKYNKPYSTFKPKYEDWQSGCDGFISLIFPPYWFYRLDQWHKFSEPDTLDICDPLKNGKGVGLPVNESKLFIENNFDESLAKIHKQSHETSYVSCGGGCAIIATHSGNHGCGNHGGSHGCGGHGCGSHGCGGHGCGGHGCGGCGGH